MQTVPVIEASLADSMKNEAFIASVALVTGGSSPSGTEDEEPL
jgi:hypothetical protein